MDSPILISTIIQNGKISESSFLIDYANAGASDFKTNPRLRFSFSFIKKIFRERAREMTEGISYHDDTLLFDLKIDKIEHLPFNEVKNMFVLKVWATLSD